jgi:EF hand domain-containing protein
MQKHVLLLTTSAVMLTWSIIAASAQAMTPGGPMTPQEPQTLQQQLERQLQGIQTQRRSFEDDRDQDDDTYDGGMMGWGYGPDWRRQWGGRRGHMGPGMMGAGMMGQGGAGPGGMGRGMMMRMLFILTDTDGDGTISLQEFQAAHERIFKAMDANKDGRLTLEEIQAFMQGPRRSVPRQ